MDVLGLSAFSGDAAAALVRDGVPLAVAEEERFTRVKHDASFPKRAIRSVLRQGQVEPQDLDWVVFYEKPLKRFERVLASQLAAFPRSGRSFSRNLFTWLGDRLWTKNRIVSEVGVAPEKVLFVEHGHSLAAGAYLPSPFDEAAVLAVGCEGEWACTSLAAGRGKEVEVLSEVSFPHSLGLVSAAFTQFLGFVPFAEEHKLFELAAWGEPRMRGEVAELLRVNPDGSYEVDQAPFRFFDHEHTFAPELAQRFGPARVPGEPLRVNGEDARDADLAASLQAVLEDALLALSRVLHERAPSPNLCLAGALAHNARANARLLREGPFERLFVQPGSCEAAGALGAALSAHCSVLDGERVFVQEHAFLGEPAVAGPEGEVPGEPCEDEDAWTRALVDHLAAGRVVGLVRGRAEWGPRSLGHRTLLADPRPEGVRERINRGIKHREDFRPYAPAVAAERASELFDLPPGSDSPARFKLVAAGAQPGVRERLPSAFHRDGTAAVQIVHREIDPQLHHLLTAFGERAGDPVLLTGALNLRGDPMIRGTEHAMNLFERSDLDVLAIEDRILVR